METSKLNHTNSNNGHDILRLWNLSLPFWIENWVKEQVNKTIFDTDIKRMQFAIALSEQNVRHQTGGPFGAAIFEHASGKLISVGVNRVIPENCSVAHAEMMAFMAAHKKIGTFDLGKKGLPLYQLVTSSQMCAMCYGALSWSGVRFVACGATSQDVEEIAGFDEGPNHPNWAQEIEKRGIQVQQELLREEACDVLRLYKKLDGVTYNGRGGSEAELNGVIYNGRGGSEAELNGIIYNGRGGSGTELNGVIYNGRGGSGAELNGVIYNGRGGSEAELNGIIYNGRGGSGTELNGVIYNGRGGSGAELNGVIYNGSYLNGT